MYGSKHDLPGSRRPLQGGGGLGIGAGLNPLGGLDSIADSLKNKQGSQEGTGFVLGLAHSARVSQWIGEVDAYVEHVTTGAPLRKPITWYNSKTSFGDVKEKASGTKGEDEDGDPMGDVLETFCLQRCMTVIPNLIHHNPIARSMAVELLCSLGNKLDCDVVSQQRAATLVTHSRLNDAEPLANTQALITTIAPALSPIAVALVGELEAYYIHHDPRVRDAAITVSTRLIAALPHLFLGQDNLAAVWNLYFLLDILSDNQDGASEGSNRGPPGSSGSSSGSNASSNTSILSIRHSTAAAAMARGTRLAICSALTVLAPVYTRSVAFTTEAQSTGNARGSLTGSNPMSSSSSRTSQAGQGGRTGGSRVSSASTNTTGSGSRASSSILTLHIVARLIKLPDKSEKESMYRMINCIQLFILWLSMLFILLLYAFRFSSYLSTVQ